MAPAREDARLYQAGAALESSLAERWGSPLYAQAPELKEA
jgi:aspartyl-tRNA(Asn)/glutamyl-tRNA(Gln) amidotransferase subunit A